ncbi:putative RNA-dependent RNA polymerase [Lyophyllum shimeji]|uniref:RNA-dependent RNA polymerase n=1 Tax=Lyophyllum shimeji TaxID=47721 RepID=A0A9P3PPK5_LYOSH|nr:putative RNA-dependent RNA polymerase [Lyophyllum shimeji]
MGDGIAVARLAEEDNQITDDVLPFPSQPQSDYGEDISGLILAFDGDSGEKPGASTQSASNASPASTTTSLESVQKRKLGGSLDTSSLTVDDRPPKKCKLDTDPNVPYIIASSRLVEQHPGLPYGVKFELGRLMSASKLTAENILTAHLRKLEGTNAQCAPEAVRVLFRDIASDLDQDTAFAQEIAATSPWEELDQEEHALAQNPYAGLGHSEQFPTWYGGKVVFKGKLEREGSSFKLKLDRPTLGPSCRFTRRFGSKMFLRIKIEKVLFYAQNNDLQEFFRKPFVLWGGVFRAFFAKDDHVFLFRTNENLVDNEIVTDPSLGMSLLQFIDWHNPPSANAKQAMTKWAARFALGLSNSVPGPMPEKVHYLDDIVSAEGSDMTDGCGEVSRAITLAVCRLLGLENCPVGIQFRCIGGKGMVTEKAETSLSGLGELWLRNSQIKIRYPDGHHDPLDPTLRIIELLRTSYMRSPSRISAETIINLAENGVPHPVFLHLLSSSIKEIVVGLTTWEGPDAMYTLWTNVERAGAVLFARRAREAAGEARVRGFGDRSNEEDDGEEDEDDLEFDKTLEERSTAWWADQTSGQPSSLEETVMVLLDAGFTPQNSPILAEKLRQVVRTRIKDRIRNFRYELPQSAIAFVVPDPYSVLGPDEIQVKSSRRNLISQDGLPTDMILGDVLLTRNPCKLPTDVRKVRAVEHSLLRHFTDVIVCSVQGYRRLLDFLAGGDYDGDTATVIWALEFVEPFKNADEKYSKEPDGLNNCFTSAGNEKVGDFLERTSALSALDQTSEIQKYLLGALRDTSMVGKYSTMHDHAVYSLGYGNPRTIKLAYKFCKVLDGAKTGLRIKPETLRADMEAYHRWRGPQWKEWKAKEDRKAKGKVCNSPFTPRGKNEFITGPFVMDHLLRHAEKEQNRILASMNDVFNSLKIVRDEHLAQPWEDAERAANRGTPELILAKKRDLERISRHVETMWQEHKAKVRENFTKKAIETRQDVLRHLSKAFVASPTLDEMETFTDAASVSRLRASCAYVYDFKNKGKFKATRFPWDMALRELCHIKATALGPSKTVTTGFYERFRLSRR